MSLSDGTPSIWMPPIIENILKNLTYKEIFEMRCVNSEWHAICTRLINKGCVQMEKRFRDAFKYLERVGLECQFQDKNRYTTFYYDHLYQLTWSYLELIQSEFDLTYACFRRYYSNHENICVFDYKILDHTTWLISRIYKYPWHDLSDESNTAQPLYDAALNRSHADNFRVLTKYCQLHFSYYVERPLNSDVTVSGAKIVDILDALLERPSCDVKMIHLQEYDPHTKLISYKATYTLYNAWFSRSIVYGNIPYAEEFNSAQYYHYIRLVRLVRYHNRFTLEIIHKNRTGQSEFWDDEATQTGISFTGKGFNNDHYYHYGCLNEKMKQIKFRNRNPNILLQFCVDLKASYRLSSYRLQHYLKSNHRDLDYDTRQLILHVDIVSGYSLLTKAPDRWSIQIP